MSMSYLHLCSRSQVRQRLHDVDEEEVWGQTSVDRTVVRLMCHGRSRCRCWSQAAVDFEIALHALRAVIGSVVPLAIAAVVGVGVVQQKVVGQAGVVSEVATQMLRMARGGVVGQSAKHK